MQTTDDVDAAQRELAQALKLVLRLNAARAFALARLRRARDRVMGVERATHRPTPTPERRP